MKKTNIVIHWVLSSVVNLPWNIKKRHVVMLEYVGSVMQLCLVMFSYVAAAQPPVLH